MTTYNPRRFAIASGLLAGLAILLLLQSISSINFKREPELSISLLPMNGLAREQFAFTEFAAKVTDPKETQAAAEYASGQARRALRSKPLAPKSHAILAMAEPDSSVRSEIISLAASLNRRDLALQGLWLNEKLSEGNFPATIEALDQILRVHPQHSEQFFPVLAEALEDQRTIPEFAQLLQGPLPWKTGFLRYAVRQRQLQPNLALLRMQIGFEGEPIDRSLIAGLVRQGLYSEAHGLYAHIIENPPVGSELTIGPWRSAYPPFDWYFVNDAGFRVQPSLNGETLDIAVRSGRGGVIIEKFIPAPTGAAQVRIKHRIAPLQQLRDVRLQANCAGNGTPYFDGRFKPGEVVFDLPQAPQGCDFVSLVIYARAWTGQSSLSGTIESFEMVEPNFNKET